MQTFGLLPDQRLETLALDGDGNPIAPDGFSGTIVPLEKLPPPEHNPVTHRPEPRLVWLEDKVQRDWTLVERPTPTRRVWTSNRAFWETFTPTEQNAIAAAIPGLSVTLAMWDGEVWSDDERIQTAMTALVGAKVLTPERANDVLTPPGLLTP